MSTAIKVENLSKKYDIGKSKAGTLSESLKYSFDWLRGRKVENTDAASTEFWALRDVSFEIQQGDVVGIIGKNGAGKSTLLKILSRITEPTNGRVEINGRVASLLEVGTGFHPELTGRENILLNGVILGMKRTEIKTRFDEIVYFSGVEKFIDTPVKYYSSGMYVRLAFAVAAHLHSEILIVDEVLSVGDAEFQKKSLGKMNEASKTGRTIIFVSHNLGSIGNLCNRAILLAQGNLIKEGLTEDIISQYVKLTSNKKGSQYLSIDNKEKQNYIVSSKLRSRDNQSKTEFLFSEKIIVETELILTNQKKEDVFFNISLLDRNKSRVFVSDEPLDFSNLSINKTSLIIKIELPNNLFAPGEYSFDLAVHIPYKQIFDKALDILNFTIIDEGSSLSKYEGKFTGNVVINPKRYYFNIK